MRGNQKMYFAPILAAVVAAGIGANAWADTYTDVFIRHTAGGQVTASATDDADSTQHALVWLANGTLVDLNPAGYTICAASATNGTQQVGTALPVGKAFGAEAVMWSGSAGSVVNLNPATGYETATAASGISPDGGQQVGNGYGSATNFNGNALLWNGTAASVVNLHPSTGYDRSFALGTDGTHQVGWGGVPNATSYDAHALLWSGTANSAVDLHPASGFVDTFANGVSGTQQVGYGRTTAQFNPSHALLWTGTAASAVDLNPSGYNSSTAYDTNGTQQVGYAQDSSFMFRAQVWSGTAISAVDLSSLLPASGTWTFSIAYDIDDSGDIFGWANGTYNGVAGRYAIEWVPTPIVTPTIADGFLSPAGLVFDPYTSTVLYELSVPTASSVPEPGALALLGLGVMGFLARRRR